MPHARSRGFALGPLLWILAVALLILVGWKLAIQLDMIPKNRPDAERLRGRMITIAVVTPLIIFAIAGGTAALGYFLCRRSERAAALGMAIPLALGVSTFAYQHYRYHTRSDRTAAAQPAPRTTSGQPVSSLPPSTAARHRVEPPPLPPRPQAPSSALPNPSTARSTPAAASPPARPAAENPAIGQVLEGLKSEIDSDCAALARQISDLYDAMASIPKPIRADVEQRLKLAQDVKAAAAQLRARISGAREEALRRLNEAGVPGHEAASSAIRFIGHANLHGVSAATHHLESFFDRAIEESNLLRDNLGRWVVRQGKFATTDKDLQRRYDTARFFIDSALSRREQSIAPLQR